MPVSSSIHIEMSLLRRIFVFSRRTSSHLRLLSTKSSSSSSSSRFANGPSLAEFIHGSHDKHRSMNAVGDAPPPYIANNNGPRKFFIESYGCQVKCCQMLSFDDILLTGAIRSFMQMNVSDSEIVSSILNSAGFQPSGEAEADIVSDRAVDDRPFVVFSDVQSVVAQVLLNTCAVREKAESKIWNRLSELRDKKTTNRQQPLIVGVLGCMAERLKKSLLESDRKVDIVCGPDAYRSLPFLLSQVDSGQSAINVQLSADETYADVAPLRESSNGVSAFVTIMRGCNNLCSFCIVPFTRGRERSRPLESILRECRDLYARGYREVTLLGQNVNSYNDIGEDESSSSSSNVESRYRFDSQFVSRHSSFGIVRNDCLAKGSKRSTRRRIRVTRSPSSSTRLRLSCRIYAFVSLLRIRRTFRSLSSRCCSDTPTWARCCTCRRRAAARRCSSACGAATRATRISRSSPSCAARCPASRSAPT
jgi:hypothetical protein